MAIKSKIQRQLTLGCIVTAILLSAVTLAVFGRLQDYGPESTIRKFDIAVATGNVNAIQNQLDEPIDSANSQKLIGWTRQMFANGATAQIRSISRKTSEADIEIVYSLPTGEAVPMIFVVRQVGRNWKIEPTDSFRSWRALFGMPG